MKLLAVVALTTLVASPAFAKERNDLTSAARAAAIHECSAVASRYTEYTWGNMEFFQYRACMAQRGQTE